MPTIAWLTPHRFHPFINRMRGRAEADTCLTRLRSSANAGFRNYHRNDRSLEVIELRHQP